jgi:hypothetical protein
MTQDNLGNSAGKSKLENKRYVIITIIAAIVVISLIAFIRFNDVLSPLQENITYNSYAEEIIDKCGSNANCAIKSLRDLAQREEKGNMIATFNGLISKYRESNIFCHDDAHHVGMYFYAYIGNVDEPISYVDPTLCGGGAYHGIVQNYMTSQVVLGQVKPEEIIITDICPEIPANPTIKRWECLHGVGHGLSEVYNYDVLTAVLRCDDFELEWEKVSCSKGLFMENVFHYRDTGTGAFKKDDLWFPCDAVDDKYAPACYHYQVSHFYFESRDIGSIVEKCESVSEDYAKYCYRGLGKVLAPRVYSDFNRANVFCQEVKVVYQADCYIGIAMIFADNRNTAEALDFCRVIPDQFKMNCYVEVGKWIMMIFNTHEGRVNECSKAKSSEYFDACMNATLEGIRIL